MTYIKCFKDYAKAFDRVHEEQLEILEKFDLQGKDILNKD